MTTNREVHKTVDHPSVGAVTVDCDVLTDGDTELKIVIMTAAPGSADETKLQLTTVVGPPAGTRNQHGGWVHPSGGAGPLVGRASSS